MVVKEAFNEMKKNLGFSAQQRGLQQESLRTLRKYKDALKNKQDTSEFVTADLWSDQHLTKARMQMYGVDFCEYSVETKESREIRGAWTEASSFTDGKHISTSVLDVDDRFQDYRTSSSHLKQKDRHSRRYVFLSSIVLDDRRIVCPACGQPSPREVLYQACPYCHSKFNIYEFNNRLAHIIPDVVGEREMNKVIRLAIVLALLFGVISAVVQQSAWALLMAIPLFIFAYLVATIIMLPKFIGSLSKWQKTRQLQWNMQKTDEFFSHDHFLGTANHRLKIWALADNPYLLQLTSYKSAQDISIIDVDVVEYRGARIRGCEVDLKAEMAFVRCVGGKLRKENKNVEMTFVRNPHVKTQLRINFEFLKCPSCGATIKLSDGGTCLYCRSPIDVRNYDWVLTDIVVKNRTILHKLFG